MYEYFLLCSYMPQELCMYSLRRMQSWCQQNSRKETSWHILTMQTWTLRTSPGFTANGPPTKFRSVKKHMHSCISAEIFYKNWVKIFCSWLILPGVIPQKILF